VTIAAIIPARGGSKGIKGKNLRELGGISLLARSIRNCLESKHIDEVWVSSEQREILLEAETHGARQIERPWHLATDETLSDQVLLHGLEWIQREGMPSILVFVQCTSPLATPQSLDGVVKKLKDSPQLDTVISVARFEGLVVEQDPVEGLSGVGFDLFDPETRRQDRPDQFIISGECWALRPGPFMRRRRIYGGSAGIFQVPRRLEIDSPSDLELAELLCDRRTIRGT
jgi:N-acylneuraminate cytidylyltransferase